jgi:hypothetical protein
MAMNVQDSASYVDLATSVQLKNAVKIKCKMLFVTTWEFQ